MACFHVTSGGDHPCAYYLHYFYVPWLIITSQCCGLVKYHYSKTIHMISTEWSLTHSLVLVIISYALYREGQIPKWWRRINWWPLLCLGKWKWLIYFCIILDTIVDPTTTFYMLWELSKSIVRECISTRDCTVLFDNTIILKAYLYYWYNKIYSSYIWAPYCLVYPRVV